jgi:hypothetical protein
VIAQYKNDFFQDTNNVFPISVYIGSVENFADNNVFSIPIYTGNLSHIHCFLAGALLDFQLPPSRKHYNNEGLSKSVSQSARTVL